MFEKTIINKRKRVIAIATNLHERMKKYYPSLGMLTIMVLFVCISDDAFANLNNGTTKKIALTNITKDLKDWITGDVTQIMVAVIGVVSGGWGAATGNMMRLVCGIGVSAT